MNAITHIAILKRTNDLLPTMVKDFLHASQDEINHWAVFPDKLDKDNLDAGYWYHSRKMTLDKKKLVWKRGSVALAIGSIRWQFRTHYKMGEFEQARLCLLKLSHYITDSCTLPHLVEKEADFLHEKLEEDMGKNVLKLVKMIDVNNKPLSQPMSIYDTAVENMERIFTEQKDALITLYKNNGSVNQNQELKLKILRECIQANVDYISSIYLDISQEDNLEKLEEKE